MFSSRLRQPTTALMKQLVKTFNGNPGRMVQLMARSMSSSAPVTYDFETLNVTRPKEFVVHVEVNRPEKRNAQNSTFYREFGECFQQLADDSDCRAVVLSGAGKIFSSGLDLTETNLQGTDSKDVGRKAHAARNTIERFQSSFNAVEKCPKSVIVAIHSACVGGGIDLASACDIRYATQDAWFQIKEVDIGLAADLGTLQRLPKVVGNESLVRELAFTARKFDADEAKSFGFVSRIFPDKEKMVEEALNVATNIAEKSPIAVQGTKMNLVYARDHSVPEGLEYVLTWNTAMLQSEDVMKAAMAAISKEKATFSKL